MKQRIPTLLAAALLAGSATLALAQPAGMMDHEGMGRHGDPARMAQMHARHLADLKAKLKLTSAQEGAWTTFTEAMKPPADLMDKQRQDRAELDKLSTPERLDRMRAQRKEHMAAMEAMMDKRAEATKAFYAVLSPEQKKVFDAEHARMDARGPHRGGMHGEDKAPAKP